MHKYLIWKVTTVFLGTNISIFDIFCAVDLIKSKSYRKQNSSYDKTCLFCYTIYFIFVVSVTTKVTKYAHDLYTINVEDQLMIYNESWQVASKQSILYI